MDQNDAQAGEQDDPHSRSHHNCHKNFIRPSSSSSNRAPSWSFGFGADISHDDQQDGHDCCCTRQLDQQLDSDTHCCCCHDKSRMINDLQAVAEHQLPTCPQMFVDIPTVYLARKEPASSSSFHVYQVNVKTSAEIEWSVYRRYSQFLALHQQLKACDSSIGKYSFPPKRRINSKASTIVQERRRKLEEYLRKLCEYVVKQPADLSNSKSYETLTNLATNGPTRLPRSSSGTVVGSALYKGSSRGSGSLTESARSEQTNADQEERDEFDGSAVNGVEQAIDADAISARTNDEELQSQSPTSVIIEDADHLETSVSPNRMTNRLFDNRNKTKSVRYLFYEFISPQGTNDAEFELDHLGV